MCTFKSEANRAKWAFQYAFSLGLVGLMAACGGVGEQATMERRAQTDLGRPEWTGVSTTSVERFGPRQAAEPHSGHGAGMAPTAPRFVYDLPEGWVLNDPTDLRLLNLKVAGREDASCYLAALPGRAGGIADNVNRWLSQFGADPMTPEQIKALPTTELFALDAVRVEASGPFSDGMGGGEIAEGSLVGLIVQQDNTMVFLKMVGPKDVIDQEKPNFDAFVKSLTFPGAPSKADMANADRELLHQVPDGWTQQAPRQMRLLGFDLPGGVDLSVTVLGGAAGGVPANINRWRDQLGLNPLPEAQLLEGERIDCLGQSAFWVHLMGAYTGMGGEAKGDGDTMFAVIVEGQKETLFVKVVGPTAATAPLEADVRAFVASLKWESSQ
ncbi:MAG: hypothetical protein P1V35_11820 [Planctomycetota bacterium]|nr:hypothetical protein [Planctomycetota bacterium]